MSQRDGMTVRHRHVNVRDPEAMVNRRGVGGGGRNDDHNKARPTKITGKRVSRVD
jgi:hypothetical protein